MIQKYIIYTIKLTYIHILQIICKTTNVDLKFKASLKYKKVQFLFIEQ